MYGFYVQFVNKLFYFIFSVQSIITDSEILIENKFRRLLEQCQTFLNDSAMTKIASRKMFSKFYISLPSTLYVLNTFIL